MLMTMTEMNALRFQCQPGCTKCCEQQGFVYLTEDDLVRIAGVLGMTAREFERRTCIAPGIGCGCAFRATSSANSCATADARFTR